MSRKGPRAETLAGHPSAGVCWCVTSAAVCTGAWDATSPLSSTFATAPGLPRCCRWCTHSPATGPTPSGSTPCWTPHKCRAAGAKPTRKTKSTPSSPSSSGPSTRCWRLCTSFPAGTMTGSPPKTSASNCTQACGPATWRHVCACCPWAPRPTSSTQRRAPHPCTWLPRQGRRCRQSCWSCTGLTLAPPTLMAAHPSTMPDHKNGHYIIPQMADSLDLSELAKAAKKKLQALSNRLFEELAMDVYDEVDRRENDAVWLATQNHSTLVTERSAVPFLPVNPEYSATRNQGRQKLARFNAREFATLIIDILSEAKRRQQGKSLSSPTDNLELSARSQSDLDDQHDYDSVASDEDTDQEPLRSAGATRNNRARSMDSSDLSDGAVTLQEYLELKKALATSEAKVQQLMKVNSSLSDELRRLQREIHKLQAENLQLRQPPGPAPTPPLPSERAEHTPMGPGGSTHRRDRQAFSMYEPGSALKPFGGAPADELSARLQPSHSSELEDDSMYSVHVPAGLYRIRKGVSASAVPFTPSSPLLSSSQEGSRHTSKLSRHGSGADSDYENTQSGDPLLGLEGKRFLELGKEEDLHPELESLDGDLDPGLPSTEDVILKTEQVTKNIQELLRAAQEFKHDSFVPCSEKIHLAVTEMASLFPKRPALEPVRSSLRLLNASAYRLQSECRKTVPPEPGAPVDFQLLTQQVIQCAYDIAKAAKQLVTITTREKKQ
ncbi:ARF GTPase-activating protein GIT1 isoform X3 [Lepus europaeus]|uniref:ARF GTPase-activating protein GIT1 isoform X3 n=1 Tax=Lepus europaeus TaxID=9983 RepID=UPI002B4801B0|nr:ARF GTPase-activating protein GIT1 isoform X3 [Lepus europaeus]